ncbi:MAG: hypothetical protein ACR2L2_18045 [Acidobacteriota bacterium]
MSLWFVSLQAAAPLLKALEPRGAQLGKVITLRLVGEGLSPGAAVVTTLPGSLSRLSTSQESTLTDNELLFLVELKGDAPVGLYPVRVQTDEGLSNVLLFSVGALLEVSEAESELKEPAEKDRNDTIASAQKIEPPTTINGTLRGPDQDFYRLTARAGQRLVFEVEARRAGSAIDPVVRVLDSFGREMVVNNDAVGLGVDARVEVLFPTAGEYFALVYDAKFSDQEQDFYRLKIGRFDYADSLFPLGWQRGGNVEVSLLGGNLPAPVKVKPNLSVPAPARFVPVGVGGRQSPQASLPFLFRISDSPEVLEPAESPAATARQSSPYDLSPATVVNGRISRPGEVDKYRLRLTPGQHWVFEVEAAALGTSQLDGLLTVYDAATNKRLGGADDGNGVDPFLAWDVPDNVNEVLLTLEDLLGRGGPHYGYRLVANAQPPDFVVDLLSPFVNIPSGGSAVVEVRVTRRGYLGPIRLTIPDLPEDIVTSGGTIPVELNPPGERFSVVGLLMLTAKPDSKPRTLRLAVWGQGVCLDGTPVLRQARSTGMVTVVRGTGQKPFVARWLDLDLPAAVAKPAPYRIEIPKLHVRLPQGMQHEIEYRLVKPSQAMSQVRVDQRSTSGVRDIRIFRKQEGSEYASEGAFNIMTTLDSPAVSFDVVLEARLIAGGRNERVAASQAVTIEIVQGYSVQFASSRVEVSRGGKLGLTGRVDREPGFKGTIKIRAEDLPEHVSCGELVLGDSQTSFEMEFKCAPDAKVGEFGIRFTSSATVPDRQDKQEYLIPEQKARLVVN